MNNFSMYNNPYDMNSWCNCHRTPMNYPYYESNHPMGHRHHFTGTDYGTKPFVTNINKVSKQNNTFRTAIWTGKHLQVTLMSIKVGEDIGLEAHPDVDQFLRIEEGIGFVQIGDSANNLYFQREVYKDDAIIVPAGSWHNLTNIGNVPLKVYSIYAPPEHPFQTVHMTREDAMAAEENER